MMIVNRGGKRIKMVKNVAFHVPLIHIGILDEYGIDLLDAMLAAKRQSINEIVDFFENYEPQPGLVFNKKAYQETIKAEIEEEKEAARIRLREKVADMLDRSILKEDEEQANHGYEFNKSDPDWKNIPFMHPDTKTYSFEDWFDIFYSICDPKGLTDEQCIQVMEIVLGGSFLEELNEMIKKNYHLNRIEKHFLKNDIIISPGSVFDKNDPDFKRIPFMTPENKDNTFKEYFNILYDVCDPKGFSDEQCLDVMQFKMGGTYLDELIDLRSQNTDLDSLELHFLSKDITQEKKVNCTT